jgi:hypothetical protein
MVVAHYRIARVLVVWTLIQLCWMSYGGKLETRKRWLVRSFVLYSMHCDDDHF